LSVYSIIYTPMANGMSNSMRGSKRLKDGPRHKSPDGRGGVQSIQRAFSILEEIACNGEGVGLAELSKKVGLHNSTTFHLVKTMTALNCIRQVKSTKHYAVGPALFALGSGAQSEIELVSVGNQVLEELAAETGECAHLAVLSGRNIVTLAKAAGTGALQIKDRIGIVRPAHATALGKVLLAVLPDDDLDRLLRREELQRYTPRTVVKPEQLLREIEEVRRTGIAFDDREFDLEMRCTAAAVRDNAGMIAAAIGISSPIWRLSMQGLEEKSRRVSEAAKRLATLLWHAH
jgi:IclR family transcriptional regulator, KDG regulon repressor